MSDITRQKTIDYLYYLKTHYPKNLIIPEYIDYAIASLETDEAYQLEYERTTKNDLSSGLKNGSPIIDWNNCHTSKQLESIATTKNDLGVDKAKKDAELIARGDVINMIKELAEYHTGDSFNADRVIVNIKQLPSVTPIRPKGHWMGDSYGYICSNCEHSLNDLAQSMDYISFSKPKYCPNCGAIMVEPQESEKIETWNGIHAQITAPKGTFERIFNDADDDNDI